MHRYNVMEPVTLRQARFRFTPQQLADRKYVVRETERGSGIFEPIDEISFKKGEIIETDYVVPKKLYDKLFPIDEEEGGDASQDAPVVTTAPLDGEVGGSLSDTTREADLADIQTTPAGLDAGQTSDTAPAISSAESSRTPPKPLLERPQEDDLDFDLDPPSGRTNVDDGDEPPTTGAVTDQAREEAAGGATPSTGGRKNIPGGRKSK